MDNVLDELVLVERRCKRGAALIDADEVQRVIASIKDAADEVGQSSSGSWLGYQSCVYYTELRPPPRGAVFSVEWGLRDTTFVDETRGSWAEYTFESVVDEVLHRAGSPDLEELETIARKADSVFEACKEELQATFEAFLAEKEDKRIQELRGRLAGLKSFISIADFTTAFSPKGALMSRDMRAMEGGLRTPPHLRVKCRSMSIESRGQALESLAKVAREARLYMAKRMNLQGKSVARTEGTVFIGHGRSPAWRDLKDLLQDRLGLKPDEFNLESAAGLTTKERLEEMLDSASFAFLVMTAEDEYADTTKHARENVIHEVGLFQGRLGFRRAIILLEDGCSEFSNIVGLGQIRFPKGNIKAKRVLNRGEQARDIVLSQQAARHK